MSSRVAGVGFLTGKQIKLSLVIPTSANDDQRLGTLEAVMIRTTVARIST